MLTNVSSTLALADSNPVKPCSYTMSGRRERGVERPLRCRVNRCSTDAMTAAQ